MTCSRCRKAFDAGMAKCPHCGEPRREVASGVFQTSTVLISVDGADRVYRSIDEVPDRLRNRLVKSTNSANSATILIADRRGRREIAKAMRNLPGTPPRRLLSSLLGGESPAYTWLTPARKRTIVALVLLMMLAMIALVFLYR